MTIDTSHGANAVRHRVDVPALDRRIDCAEDETLFAAARRAGLRIVGACGGRGTCGTCIVRVAEGRVHRDGEPAHRKWLRACRLQPRSDLALEIAPRSLAPVVRADVAVAGVDAVLHSDPAVFAVELQLAPATLHDQASDLERATAAIAAATAALAPTAVDSAAIAELPPLLRARGWQVSARLLHPAAGLSGTRLIGFAPPRSPLLGLAVDLGSTNAAAFLIDLACGTRLASLGLENPQVAWGADLISRVNHAVKSTEAAQALQRAAAGVINALAHDLAWAVGARPSDIAEIAVCGNTAMQHLLAGWPVAQLGRAPFVAAARAALDLPARDLGLALAAGANLHLAPAVGGFVGGDHVAALLATEPLWSAPGTTLVMDIGTNTELSLVHGGRIRSASCPSGPALEGGHIGCGMRAAEGAIERVEIDACGRLRLQVIGEVAPVGLCGSGVLDAIAAFVRAGWVDSRGRVVCAQASPETGEPRAITLVDATPKLLAVRMTQNDVRSIQLAKSAIRSGVHLLAAQAGVDEAAIDRFVIAGAFGAYLRVESGVAIGLFPDLPRERFRQVGNAAGLGVQQMLASRARRERASALASECRHVELSTCGDFQKVFLHHIAFPSPP